MQSSEVMENNEIVARATRGMSPSPAEESKRMEKRSTKSDDHGSKGKHRSRNDSSAKSVESSPEAEIDPLKLNSIEKQ